MMIRIDFEGKSRLFQNPIKIFVTNDIALIKDYIDEISAFVNQGYYAVGYLAYESAEAFNAFNKTKDYRDNKLPLLLFGIFEQYTTHFPQENHYNPHKLDLISNTSRAEYDQNIDHIKQQIEDGNTYQTNYTIEFNGQFEGDPLAYYHFLQQNNQANYCAYIKFGDLHILSISPELFFKLDGETITTKPMKGTTGRGINLTEDMSKLTELNSEKNQAENMMIVDLLRNDLSRMSEPGSVTVTELFTAEKYPTVWQLTSTIQSKLIANTSLYQILQALFPCGSITGAPKASTMKIIADIEKQSREVYCGTIGYIEPNLNKAIFNIPIRTLTINGQKASYGVGGGVTWDSTNSGEYNEIIEKTAILNTSVTIPEYLIESLLYANGEFFLLDEHLQRLLDSAYYFDFKCNRVDIKNSLMNLTEINSLASYKIRVCLKANGDFTIESAVIVNNMDIIDLKLSPNSVNSHNIYLYHKTSNRSHLPLIKPGQEFIVFNEKDEITEFVNGNIVLLINDKWVTPRLSSGLLPGLMRSHYLQQGIITEETILIGDIHQAEKIAFINSVRKWIPISQDTLVQLKRSIKSK